MANRKNILILITDQQTHRAMSCAGNDWLNTPAMDALARRGTQLTRAYCTYPLCSPARASHMTGKYPHQANVWGNAGKPFWKHEIAREEFLGYPMGQAGYRCVWAGKDMPPADGSRDFELLCRWGDVQTADHLCEFVAGEHDRPFLAVGNFVNPHNICEWARGMPLFEGGIGEMPRDEDLPPLPANFAVPPYEPQIIRKIQQLGLQVFIGQGFDERRWRQYIWAYYRMVEMVDRQVGRVLDVLRESGLEDDTLVMFLSDHGDGCGAHRWNQKMTFYEEVIRVPMILAGPGVAAGARSEALVSTGLDIFPTCCEIAGADLPGDLPGRSLLDLCDGTTPADWRDELTVESAMNPEILDSAKAHKQNMGRCIVTGRYKYSVWKWGTPREQLVDLQEDPGEMVNLAVVGRYRDLLEQMRGRLYDWTQATDDPFMVPGREILSPGAQR
ncbi:MAG: sulfatase [Phycisphaerae bacterium]